jgi:hypothetical protein
LTLAQTANPRYLDVMTFQSLPYDPRPLTATEARLEAIYAAAKLGLKGDSLALAAGMTPTEYRKLCQMDPIAEYAEQKGRAEGERAMATTLYAAAEAGDAKAATEMLRYAHGWVAKQAVEVSIGDGGGIDGLQRDVEPEAQVAVAVAVDGEVLPLQQDRQVGRLLELEDEDPLLDRVGQSRRHEHGIAGADLPGAQRGEKAGAVVRGDHGGHLSQRHGLSEAHADARTRRRIDDVPRLGLAVGQAEMTASELAIGVQMHGKALAKVEELHEHLDVGAIAGHVCGPEPGSGVGDHGIAQVGPVREQAEPLGRLTEPCRGRSDPLLRPLGSARTAAQGADPVATAVEVVELVDGQEHGGGCRRHGPIVASGGG